MMDGKEKSTPLTLTLDHQNIVTYSVKLILSKNSKKLELPVEFIFIDGDHDLRAVAKDFESWFPKVIDGGTIAFHDSWNFIGPNILTACLLLFSPKVKNPGLINRITYFEKTEKNSMLDRFRNIKFLLHRTMFALKIFIYKNRKKLRKFIRNRI